MNLLTLERDVLRAICQGTEGGAIWQDAMRLLGDYRFRDVTHQMVFEALAQMRAPRAEIIREHLQRRLALSGFPDLSLATLFEPHGLNYQQAMALVEQLAGADRRKKLGS